MSARTIARLVAGLACLAAGPSPLALTTPSYAAGAGGLPTHVNSCWTTDNGSPVVDSFTLSTHAVDVTDGPATVTITVDAHDRGGPGPATGIRSIHVQALQYWPDADGVPQNHGGIEVPLHPDGTDWVGSYTVPKHSPAAQVRFDAVEVAAVRGPSGGFSSFGETGAPTEIVEVTSAHPDTAAPTLVDVVLSRDHVDVSRTGRDVVVTAHVVDDDSGVARVGIEASAPGPLQPTPMTPTGSPGEFRHTIHVPHGYEADQIGLTFHLTDVALNDRWTSAAGSTIAVSGGSPRAIRPRLVSVNGRHQTIDVRRPHAHWNIRVHATDAGSGVGTVSTYRPAVAGAVEAGAPVQLHLVSGNRHDGVWGARLRVPRCAMSPGHNAANYVTVTDRSGLYATTTPIGPRLIGPDHRPPGLQGGTSAGIVGLDFYEAVHGISRSTVAVYARSPSGEAVRQQGSWTCTGRREHIVSCRTGAVRHATFRYDGPPGSAVDLEPEGHLDVIDGHGNPQLALISVED